jgi:glycosyltransferase involved in cell wall biosynthesis
MNVLHIITGLNTGGAEMMLYKLLRGMDRATVSSEVISLAGGIGPVGQKIQALGIPVRSLGMQAGVPDPRFVRRLQQIVQAYRPDVVQTWMYHADLLGGLATRMVGDIPVVWNVRHGPDQSGKIKKTTRWVLTACAKLSQRIPTAIVTNATSTRDYHVVQGYNAANWVIIPNGFDLDQFRPDSGAKRSVRQNLGLSSDARLIGMVARFHEEKGHQTFVEAAQVLGDTNVKVQFVLCGSDVTWNNTRLHEWIDATGLPGQFHLLGERDDVPHLTASLDIATLSSHCEAFPNVVGEAMACGVPCAVTDVGDSAAIVGETGLVVPPQNPRMLAMAWKTLLDIGPAGRARLGQKARQRVADHYSLATIVKRYEALYQEIGQRTAGTGPVAV